MSVMRQDLIDTPKLERGRRQRVRVPTLIGMQTDEGLTLDRLKADVDWLPELESAGSDPRDAITLQHALHMSTDHPVDSFQDGICHRLRTLLLGRKRAQ